MPPIHVLVVDDSPAFLTLVALFLATDPQIVIAGSVHSGREALVQVAQIQPDLVLMDVHMPDMDGLEATRRIKAQPGAPRILVCTLLTSSEYRAAAETAGADGFLDKASFTTQLLPIIHTLCAASLDPQEHEA